MNPRTLYYAPEFFWDKLTGYEGTFQAEVFALVKASGRGLTAPEVAKKLRCPEGKAQNALCALVAYPKHCLLRVSKRSMVSTASGIGEAAQYYLRQGDRATVRALLAWAREIGVEHEWAGDLERAAREVMNMTG
jgi:hypothetical protein